MCRNLKARLAEVGWPRLLSEPPFSPRTARGSLLQLLVAHHPPPRKHPPQFKTLAPGTYGRSGNGHQEVATQALHADLILSVRALLNLTRPNSATRVHSLLLLTRNNPTMGTRHNTQRCGHRMGALFFAWPAAAAILFSSERARQTQRLTNHRTLTSMATKHSAGSPSSK